MTTSTFDSAPAAKADVAIGLAAEAWAAACRRAGRAVTVPTAVVPLKPQRPGRKSGTYRLEGAGDKGAPVIAKRSRRSSALIEREVYQRLLPAMELPALTFYGSIEDEDDEQYWLFMEDAGGVKLTEDDRALAARWMARLHTSAAALADQVSLPERGVAHYREHLRAALANLGQSLAIPTLSAGERTTLECLRRRLDRLEARWEVLCHPSEALPRTLVHGDFCRKNCRVRTAADGPSVIALDWEKAGWGPPAADLADWSRPSRKTANAWRGTVALDVYAAAVADAWPGVTLRDVEQQARVGAHFRLVAAVHWASGVFNAGGGLVGVDKLAALDDALVDALVDALDEIEI